MQRPARRADGVAGVFHVLLRLKQRDRRPARVDAPNAEAALVLVLRARQVPALRKQLEHLEADVVARAGVARPGIAQADAQPVRVIALEESQCYSSEDSASAAASPACAASSPVAPSAPASAAASSPTSAASSSSSGSAGSSDGMTIVAMIVSSRSSRKTTPSGGVTA